MPIYLMRLLVAYKKGKKSYQREVEVVSKGETVAQINKRSTTIERIKQQIYGKNKHQDILVLKIKEKKLISYGIKD